MSIILMKFNFADLVAARPVREGRHLSCWGGGCFELQGSLEGDLVLGRMEKTWYLEGPWKKTGCLSIQTDVITSVK